MTFCQIFHGRASVSKYEPRSYFLWTSLEDLGAATVVNFLVPGCLCSPCSPFIPWRRINGFAFGLLGLLSQPKRTKDLKAVASLASRVMTLLQEGVLTIETAGHLGSMMTQYAMLYALSRRDSKYAFLPPELYVPLKQVFPNIRQIVCPDAWITQFYLMFIQRVVGKHPVHLPVQKSFVENIFREVSILANQPYHWTINCLKVYHQ